MNNDFEFVTTTNWITITDHIWLTNNSVGKFKFMKIEDGFDILFEKEIDLMRFILER